MKLTDARYARDATPGRLLPEESQLTTSDANGNSSPVPAEQMVNVPDCGTSTRHPMHVDKDPMHVHEAPDARRRGTRCTSMRRRQMACARDGERLVRSGVRTVRRWCADGAGSHFFTALT